MTATLRQVADRAGVSPAHASRVIAGEGYFADDTALRVKAAVKELGYQRGAAGHRGGRPAGSGWKGDRGGGGERPNLQVKVDRDDLAAIDTRAVAEVADRDGRSEMTRRLLNWALHGPCPMPVGWVPPE